MEKYKVPSDVKKKALQMRMKKYKYKVQEDPSEGEITSLQEGKEVSRDKMEKDEEARDMKLLKMKPEGSFYEKTLQYKLKRRKK